QEVAPMVVAQALAAGKRAVVTRVGGVPEFVADGENGFLCEPEDAAGLARALRRALDVPRDGRIEARARETAWRLFHPGAVAERTEQVFREVLARSSAGRGPAIA